MRHGEVGLSPQREALRLVENIQFTQMTPTIIGWAIVVGCTRKYSVRKVIPIIALFWPYAV